MSSAVLADKHVDSFGPKLLSEARRGTVCSFPHPAGEHFSSSPPCWGQGTGIGDTPLPPVFKLTWIVGKGREKVGSPFPPPLPCICSYRQPTACASGPVPPVRGVWCSNLPPHVAPQFLQSQFMECSVLSNSSIVSQVWFTLRMDFILKAKRSTPPPVAWG